MEPGTTTTPAAARGNESDALVQRPNPNGQPNNYVLLVVSEARPVVQIVFLLRFAVGAALTAHASSSPWRIADGALCWWLAVVAVYTFNGAMDFAEDVANASNRPIARGDLPRHTALRACAGATLVAIILAGQDTGLDLWLGLYLIAGWWYSASRHPAKRRTSTAGLVVFGLGWSSYAAGAASAGGSYNPKIMVFGLAGAAWMALVGTVIKDISDVEGDAASGRRTLAVNYGPRFAQHCATVGAVFVGAVSVFAALERSRSVLVGTVPFALGAIYLVAQDLRPLTAGSDDRAGQRRGYRVFMRTQYLANVVMLATRF